MYVYAYITIFICIYVHVYVDIYIDVYYIYVYIFIYVCVCEYVNRKKIRHIRICTCQYLHTYIVLSDGGYCRNQHSSSFWCCLVIQIHMSKTIRIHLSVTNDYTSTHMYRSY